MSISGNWAIAIHGGAGGISRKIDRTPYEHALKSAVDAAQRVLVSGRGCDAVVPWDQAGVLTPPTAMGAALAAVEVMEACHLFNAGRGGALNNKEFVENEASVMDGALLKTGAVCGLRTVVHPARLAAVVYAKARFQFLGFSAAERYADSFPTLIERKDPSWFITEKRVASLARAKARESAQVEAAEITESEMQNISAKSRSADPGETVGATVCDGEGNVACVTSTGGVTNKWEGRIGDTPVIGAGSYASNKSCAVSGTGWGEQFLRHSAASRICFAIEYGKVSVKDAVYDVVHNVFPDDTGGFVGVTPSGEIVMDFNSPGMFRACRNWQGEEVVRIWN